MLEQEFVALLFFRFRLQLGHYAEFDNLEYDGAELQRLLMHDIDALHDHVRIIFVSLLMLNLH